MNILKPFFLVSFLLFSFFSNLDAQSLIEYPPLLELEQQYRDQLEGVSEYTILRIDDAIRSDLRNAKSKHLKIRIPINADRSFNLELEQFKLVSDDFQLKTSEGEIVDYEPGIFYRGKIVGHEGFAVLSFMNDHMMGVISTKREGNFNLGKMEKTDDYVIYNDKNMSRNNDYECHTPDPLDNITLEELEVGKNRRGLSDCVKLYVEGDNALRINKGGVSQASDYIMEIVSVVAEVYLAEDINVEISEIMVWTIPDGYSTNDAGSALDDFEINNPDPNGDLAHLFALGGSGTGGLAWVNVLCSSSNYAYSNISAWYQSFPNYSWTIEVVSHEMGHNIGSRHTHSCTWPGGAIDNCYNTEGSCAPGQPPVNGGTIMSYCHLTSDGINFSHGFGPLPGDRIRSRVSSAWCLSSCTGGILPPVADFSFVEGDDNCAPSEVQFTDNSLNSPSDWLWTFDGGVPASSIEQNPIVTYLNKGVYDVSLTVSNGAGSDDMEQLEIIEVIDVPVVGFGYTINGQEVTFTNSTTGGVNYYWDFGDGNSSTAFNTSHTYANDGVYNVTLTASNDCGSPVLSQSITIATSPSAAYSVTDTSGCVAFTVKYNNSSSSNAQGYAWTFEGGTPNVSTEKSPTIVYNQPGDFDATLIVNNPQGSDTMLVTDYITVQAFPTATISSTVNGAVVNFSAPNYSNTSYAWSLGDGASSTDKIFSHTYTNEGTYQVELITNNSNCSDTSNVSVVILFTPVVVFAADKKEDCGSLVVNFTNNTAGTNTYLWTFSGGSPATSTDKSPTVNYNSPGVYTVKLEATNSSGTTVLEETNYITVHSVPVVDMSYVNTALLVDFTNLSTNATAYNWNFGDGNTSTDENPNNTYSQEGIYTVKLTVDYPCGTKEKSFELNLFTTPTADFSSSNTLECAPYSVVFEDNSSSNTASWLWSFVGGNPTSSTEQNPTVVYENAGIYDVSLTVTNPAGDNTVSNDGYIEIMPITESSFGWDINVKEMTLNNNSINADDYHWAFGDGSTSSEESPIHSYEDFGDYNVKLNVSGPCGEDSIEWEVNLKPDAVIVHPSFSGLDIYPNPVDENLTIKLENSERLDLVLSVYDIYGRLIMTDRIFKDKNLLEHSIDVRKISMGSYILKLSTNEAQIVEKIVVY